MIHCHYVRPTSALPSSPSASWNRPTCSDVMLHRWALLLPDWYSQHSQERLIVKSLLDCGRICSVVTDYLTGGIVKTTKPPPPPKNNNNKIRKTQQQQKTRSNNNKKTVLLAVFYAFNLCWCSLIPSRQLWSTSWHRGRRASRARAPVSDGDWQWCSRWHR